MKLSACVIVKNEEKNLPRWLDCMKKIVNELIVVDTGSTDRTVDLALEAGAKTYAYKWRNDFAAAKNFAIAKSTGKWIIFLDADEYFAPNCIKKIPLYLCQLDKQHWIDAVTCRIVNIDTDIKGRIINTFSNVRIFRRSEHICYTNNVHETLVNRRREMGIYSLDQVVEVYHTGYSSSVIREKLLRNLALLKQDIGQAGEQPKHYRYLCDCYHGLKEYEKTIKYAHLHLQSGYATVGGDHEIYKRLIDAMVLSEKPMEEVLYIMQEAISVYPEEPTFLFAKGDYFLQKERLKEAEQCLRAAILLDQKRIAADYATDLFILYRPEAYYDLACLMKIKGKQDEAFQTLLTGLQKNPYHERLFQAFCTCLSTKKTSEILDVLERFYRTDKEEDLLFLLRNVQKEPLKDIELYYLNLAREKNITIANGKYRYYYAAAKFEKAAIYLTNKIQPSYMKLLVANLLSEDQKLRQLCSIMLPQAYQNVLAYSLNELCCLSLEEKILYEQLKERTKAYGITLPPLPSLTLREQKRNSRKIACITCVNDEKMYEISLEYLAKLKIPKGYAIECIAIRGASSMAEGYNQAMAQTDAKYKIYMHQDLFVIYENFFMEIVQLFQKEESIGMLGLAGTRHFDPPCIWWLKNPLFGKMYYLYPQNGEISLHVFGEFSRPYQQVTCVDGALIATQYDLKWREDLFDGWHFYDISQSFEFRANGYFVAIPHQIEPWCVHSSGDHDLKEEYKQYLNIFEKHYLSTE